MTLATLIPQKKCLHQQEYRQVVVIKDEPKVVCRLCGGVLEPKEVKPDA